MIDEIQAVKSVIDSVINLHPTQADWGKHWFDPALIVKNLHRIKTCVNLKYIKENDSVCDIGADCGYTLWFLKNVYNCDINGVEIEDQNFHMTREALGLTPYVSTEIVRPQINLTLFPKKFNVITVLYPNFNKKQDGTDWGKDEWEFFLNDISTNFLQANGYIIVARPRNWQNFEKLCQDNNNLQTASIKFVEKNDSFFFYQKI